MRKVIVAFVTLGILIASIWLIIGILQRSRLFDAYDHLQRGMPEQLVRQMFGTPSHVAGPPQYVSWDTDESKQDNTGDCVMVFSYTPRLTLCGEEFLIGFDQKSNAVSKYCLFSP